MKNISGSQLALHGSQSGGARVSLLSPRGIPAVAAAKAKMKTESHQDILSVAAEAGVVVADLSLEPIAMDRGAIAILTDIQQRSGGGEASSSLPSQITERLKGFTAQESSGFRIQLRGERYEYSCRLYVLEPLNRVFTKQMVMLHLQRGSSANDAICQLAAECSLTDREEQVIVGISMGLTSKELAERMNISPNTVRAFLRLIMVKMGVTTRSAIVGKLLNYRGKSNTARPS
jgi:DNA-binding CsgD family transcriptional regulator